MNAEEVKLWAKGCRDVLLQIERNGLWICPECKHLMPYSPDDYHICPVCGVEFGLDAEARQEAPIWARPTPEEGQTK